MTLISSLLFSISSPYLLFFFLLNINDDFSAFCYGQSNATKEVMVCLLGWCYKSFRTITTCYKSYIIKYYLLGIQHSKCTFYSLFLTLVQMFSPCFCLSHIHSACSLWDHLNSSYPQPGMTRERSCVTNSITSCSCQVCPGSLGWFWFPPQTASFTCWQLAVCLHILANAGYQCQVQAGLWWNHSVLGWKCTDVLILFLIHEPYSLSSVRLIPLWTGPSVVPCETVLSCFIIINSYGLSKRNVS